MKTDELRDDGGHVETASGREPHSGWLAEQTRLVDLEEGARPF